MSRTLAALCFVLIGSTTSLSPPAEAGTGYAFTVENNNATAMTVYADGKTSCEIAPGTSCRVVVSHGDARFAYAWAGGPQTSFDPGNLEAVDLCKADAGGIHCIDPSAN